MQHAAERVERPGESQEALDGKKNQYGECFSRDETKVHETLQLVGLTGAQCA